MAYFKKNNKKSLEYEKVSYILPIWSKSLIKHIDKSLSSLIVENKLIREIIIVFDGQDCFQKNFHIPKVFINKIIFVYCSKNRGPGIARNKGSLFAKSRYLFFLDAGDISSSNRVAQQIKYLKKYDVSFGSIKELLPNGAIRIKRSSSNIKIAKKIIPYRSPFNNVTMAIKKDLFLKIGGYADLRAAEDWVLMAKIIKNNLKINSSNNILVNVLTGTSFLDRRSGYLIYKDLKKCLKEIYFMKLMNKFEYIFSLFCQFFTRIIIPRKFLSFIYNFLRE